MPRALYILYFILYTLYVALHARALFVFYALYFIIYRLIYTLFVALRAPALFSTQMIVHLPFRHKHVRAHPQWACAAD